MAAAASIRTPHASTGSVMGHGGRHSEPCGAGSRQRACLCQSLGPKDQHLLDLPLVLLLRSPRQSELWVVDYAVLQHIHRINMHAQPVCPVLCSWHALS